MSERLRLCKRTTAEPDTPVWRDFTGRTGGGKGLVVDVSRHMNRILGIHPEERWVRVQPGVVLDELNLYCKPYGLFFGPETSTSNRCCVGGMVGNNSCGSHSLVYGSTRDHLLEAEVVLSGGSVVVLKGLTDGEVKKK